MNRLAVGPIGEPRPKNIHWVQLQHHHDGGPAIWSFGEYVVDWTPHEVVIRLVDGGPIDHDLAWKLLADLAVAVQP